MDESVKYLAGALREENLQETMETPSKSNGSAITPQKSKYGEFENNQDEFSRQLRVQIDQGLKVVPAPYLAPLAQDMKNKYTLVLDLDETLLHFEEVSFQILNLNYIIA